MTTSTANTSHIGQSAARYLLLRAQTRDDALGALAKIAGMHGIYSDANRLTIALKAPIEALNAEEAAEMLRPIVTDFVRYARPFSLLGRLPAIRKVPLLTRMLNQTTGAAAAWVGEALPTPVFEAGFAAGASLPPRKVAAIWVETAELIRSNRYEPELLRDGAAALGTAIDTALLNPDNAGTAYRPKAITSGDPQINSSGSTPAAVAADVRKLIDSLVTYGSDLRSAAFLMPTTVAGALASMRNADMSPTFPTVTALGGTLSGLPVFTHPSLLSAASPGEASITLIDQDMIVYGDDGDGELGVSGQAAIQMRDDPVASAATQVSMWASNLAAFRAVRVINWARRRTGATATLRGVQL